MKKFKTLKNELYDMILSMDDFPVFKVWNFNLKAFEERQLNKISSRLLTGLADRLFNIIDEGHLKKKKLLETLSHHFLAEVKYSLFYKSEYEAEGPNSCAGGDDSVMEQFIVWASDGSVEDYREKDLRRNWEDGDTAVFLKWFESSKYFKLAKKLNRRGNKSRVIKNYKELVHAEILEDIFTIIRSGFDINYVNFRKDIIKSLLYYKSKVRNKKTINEVLDTYDIDYMIKQTMNSEAQLQLINILFASGDKSIKYEDFKKEDFKIFDILDIEELEDVKNLIKEIFYIALSEGLTSYNEKVLLKVINFKTHEIEPTCFVFDFDEDILRNLFLTGIRKYRNLENNSILKGYVEKLIENLNRKEEDK